MYSCAFLGQGEGETRYFLGSFKLQYVPYFVRFRVNQTMKLLKSRDFHDSVHLDNNDTRLQSFQN